MYRLRELLTTRDALILLMRKFCGFSYAQIGNAFGLSITRISQISRKSERIVSKNIPLLLAADKIKNDFVPNIVQYCLFRNFLLIKHGFYFYINTNKPDFVKEIPKKIRLNIALKKEDQRTEEFIKIQDKLGNKEFSNESKSINEWESFLKNRKYV